MAELLTKSYKILLVESDFVKSSATLINLVSNSAAELLPISSFPSNSEELRYENFSSNIKILNPADRNSLKDYSKKFILDYFSYFDF